jgi:DNA repair photolyase
MSIGIKVGEIDCAAAIGKCGFPGGGWAVNPYVGCAHDCVYCYARFIKRFTGHNEAWGGFVDVRVNMVEVLKKQLKSAKYREGRIYIGTVTDPYQSLEERYKITRSVLEVLMDYGAGVSILTKSNLVLRDLDLLRKFKDIDVNFTLNSFDEKWKSLVEPNSPSIKDRIEAVKRIVANSIKVYVMVGPYWPFFTDASVMLRKFKELGVSGIFTESFNTVGGNWSGVEGVLTKNCPNLLPEFRQIMFNKEKFNEFYDREYEKIMGLSKELNLPATVYFGQGHAAKFK